MVQERVGLRPEAIGFSLYEVLGQLERNMLPSDKVSDAMFKWEKYAKSTGSNKTLKLTFKVVYVCTYYKDDLLSLQYAVKSFYLCLYCRNDYSSSLSTTLKTVWNSAYFYIRYGGHILQCNHSQCRSWTIL